MRILLTTTSYQDTPGKHHQLLESSGFTIVRERGPLPESRMLELVAMPSDDGGGTGFDAILHGDDAITREVIRAALPRLKCLSKYGIGLDSVDVPAATELRVPVLFTPGVNHTTVAEHTFGLMIMLAKKLLPHLNQVKAGQWQRVTGSELANKTIAILGLGRIGKEVAKRARAFGMHVIAFDVYWDEAFAKEHEVTRCWSAEEAITKADVVTLHMNLTEENRHLFDEQRLTTMRDGAMIINCARGGLVDEQAVAQACQSGKLSGYAADVLEHEPMQTPHVFQGVENILITPHIGSRTFESVERQALMATENMLRVLRGEAPLAQANELR